MPKVNVYLPDDPADEVRAAQLSLSPICQRAIREELDKVHAQQAATSDIERVAARLRTTISADEAERRAEGRKDGTKWAREYATARELEEMVADFAPGDGGWFEAGHSIYDFVSAKEGRRIIRVSPTGESPEGAYWDGFIEGAQEVYEAVNPLL